MAGDTDAVADAAARERDELIDGIVGFLTSIGIEVEERPVGEGEFLPGLRIEGGRLLFERARLLHPGDLFHDAAHIAVREAADRPNMSGDVLRGKPERNGEEIVALLWSYAAALEAGVDPAIVFHEQGYKGQASWILGGFQSGQYTGLPLLAWMGLTKPMGEPDGFPRMLKWLRD